METRRDETSPLIIEEEKSCPHRPSIVATSCYHLNPSWRRPARGRMKATSRQNRLLRGSWEWGHFEIVCAQHIDGVGDDGGEVSDGGDVETVMPYLATCQFTETWRMHLIELPLVPFVLLLLRISLFTASICMFDFSYFSAISFGFMGFLLTWKLLQYVSVLLSIWQLNKLDLWQNFICISKFFL